MGAQDVGIAGQHGRSPHRRSGLRGYDDRMAGCASAGSDKVVTAWGVLRGPETWLGEMVGGGKLGAGQPGRARPENQESKTERKKEKSFGKTNHGHVKM